MGKTAVVLLNLGAPDHLGAVEPFLYNLFRDPAILSFRIPQFIRNVIARLIARKRTPTALHIYEQLGGKSPLYENTQMQALKLQESLGDTYSVHVAMRYWHPFAGDVISEFIQNPPSEIILVPLYPQFSTTTTQSSLKEWMTLQKKSGLDVPVKYVCCFPKAPGFIKAQADLLMKSIEASAGKGEYRVLFSAHGLPQRIVDSGDPYPRHVLATAEAISARLPHHPFEWRVCYQSRVGPVAWLKPYADQEIEAAGREGKGVILVPLSFVSEHSETLVELDREFRDIAEKAGVSFYERVPTVSVQADFIHELKKLVEEAHSKVSNHMEFSYFCKKPCAPLCKGVCYA
jgi:ferrochelatase